MDASLDFQAAWYLVARGRAHDLGRVSQWPFAACMLSPQVCHQLVGYWKEEVVFRYTGAMQPVCYLVLVS